MQEKNNVKIGKRIARIRDNIVKVDKSEDLAIDDTMILNLVIFS